MYAVDRTEHPLWTTLTTYRSKIGPGYYRFNFGAYADVAATPRGDRAVRAHQYSLRPDQHSPHRQGGSGCPTDEVSLDKSKVVGEDLRTTVRPANIRMAWAPRNSQKRDRGRANKER